MQRVSLSLDLLVLSFVFVTAELRTVLVKDLDCYIATRQHAHCSWEVEGNAQNLRSFYRLLKEDGSVSIYDDAPPPSFQECSPYSHSHSSRVGCDLPAAPTDEILLFFNGTLAEGTVGAMEPFRREFHLRPPALNWTVTKTRDVLNISWIPPDITPPKRWEVIIHHTECGNLKDQIILQNAISGYQLLRIPSCRYAIDVKARKIGGAAETPSSVKYVDAEPEPNVAMYAIIAVPLVLAGLAVLTIVCFRTNKERIFPEIPKPLDLISDISENNNKCIAHNLYVVAEEEDSCKVTLVMDP